MMIERCSKCQKKPVEVRCMLCKRGYCNTCASFVNGLCSSCLKGREDPVSNLKDRQEGSHQPTYFK